MVGKFDNVFLDLEETIIRSWTDPFLVNVRGVDAFLTKACRVREVGIFSFAVDGEKDLRVFAEERQPRLEAALDCKVTHVVTVHDMMLADRAMSGQRWIGMDEFEFIPMRGKLTSKAG